MQSSFVTINWIGGLVVRRFAEAIMQTGKDWKRLVEKTGGKDWKRLEKTGKDWKRLENRPSRVAQVFS
jgi:hypothetical protein